MPNLIDSVRITGFHSRLYAPSLVQETSRLSRPNTKPGKPKQAAIPRKLLRTCTWSERCSDRR